MSIVTQTDKRTGITYAYDTTYYWDKEKQQSRSKRVCVGKVDPETGDIVPTRGRAKKGSKSTSGKSVKTGPKPFVETRHLYYGATYLLNEFANELGLTADLRQCFPETYKQLLSVVFYLILEDNNPLYRFEKWHLTHKHPYGEDITSPRSSELFASITDNQVNKFFRLQGKRRVNLPQLNLLLVFGEKSGLPFYYRKLAGNIPDSKTVKHLLEDLDILGFGKTKFVMDRGFYSEDNINGLYREHIKFLVGTKLSLKINAGYTSIIITALKMVLTMSRHSTNELPAFAKNC